jgi:hypothetical protein
MSRASLPIILGIILVTLAGLVGGIVLLRTASPGSAEVPLPLPVQAAPALPAPAVPPVVAPIPSVPEKTPDVPAERKTPDPLPPILTELNAALPQLGVSPPARLIAIAVEKDLLVLTFNAEFRSHLDDLSALDELTAALSGRAQTHGYLNVDLRMVDSRGRTRSLAELTVTPPARRPRPEPIDDGVRR